MGKYRDFQSALNFLLNYGFEFCIDSTTGKMKCYKNEYGEIVLRYKQFDPKYYVPVICIEINRWKNTIDIYKEYSLISKKKYTKFYDMTHDVIKHQLKSNKIFDLRINAKYHKQVEHLRIINNLDEIIEMNNESLSGKLRCSCNCTDFNIYHTGKQTKGILTSDIVKYKLQIVIEAKCIKCNKSIRVLDTSIDGIKTKEIEQFEFKKLILKKHIDTFNITMMYNYYKEDYKTNNFVDCFIDVGSDEIKTKRRIYEG